MGGRKPAASAPSTRLSPNADSDSTNGTLKTIDNVWDKFRVSSDSRKERLKNPLKKMDRAVLREPWVWEELAYYLLEEAEHERKPGERIHAKTALEYWNKLLNTAGAYGKEDDDPKTRMFFQAVLDNGASDAARWCRSMRNKIGRVGIENMREAGTTIDQSATPVGIRWVRAALKAYAQMNTAEVHPPLAFPPPLPRLNFASLAHTLVVSSSCLSRRGAA